MTRNHMVLTFPSLAENESFARVAVAAFAVQLSPTLSEIADLKTAVSEAVTMGTKAAAERSPCGSAMTTGER